MSDVEKYLVPAVIIALGIMTARVAILLVAPSLA
jgi:hypothetical protein